MSESNMLTGWRRAHGGLGILRIVALCGLFLVGCLGRSPEVEHYILGAGPHGASAVGGEFVSQESVRDVSEVAVLVGPVTLPAYLRRPQLARLESGGEIELDEFGRWLGGFEENFLRGISLGLAAQLGSVKVVAYPSNAPFTVDYQVRLHIDDFILIENENVMRVRIRWALIREDGETPAELFLLEKTLPVAGSSREGLVMAHEQALRELTTAISREIRQP